MSITIDYASLADLDALAEMNHQMILDEHNRNPMTRAELAERMRGWIESGTWHVMLIREDGQTAGYCVFVERRDEYFPERPEVYVRHFFIAPDRRRRGLGRAAFQELARTCFPAGARLVLDVLATNPVGLAFWQSLGFAPYCATLDRAR
ncbi:MAG: GNAT family N-acetyltransferase [Chloroflexi bacterium]|nr:GNAT family N-acetyltransferase [Chloroflexota bacterium]